MKLKAEEINILPNFLVWMVSEEEEKFGGQLSLLDYVKTLKRRTLAMFLQRLLLET